SSGDCGAKQLGEASVTPEQSTVERSSSQPTVRKAGEDIDLCLGRTPRHLYPLALAGPLLFCHSADGCSHTLSSGPAAGPVPLPRNSSRQPPNLSTSDGICSATAPTSESKPHPEAQVGQL